MNLDSVPLPLLITGLAGVPGYNAFTYFRQHLGESVIAVRRQGNWPLSGPGIVACDVADTASLERLWQKHRFAAVLSCAGSCRLKSCELDPAMAQRVNVLATENVMKQAARHRARVVHLSIDLVFSGHDGGNYTEADAPDPVTVYGRTMVEAERVVFDHVPDACVLRISLPMGVSFSGHAGAIDWIASRFKQGKPATLYFDEVRTPTYTGCLSRLFARLLADPLPGLFHAGGPRRLSLHQIAQIVNVVGGYDPALVQGCLRHEAGPMPPRAGDVSLDGSKLAKALGYPPFQPWPLDETLIPKGRQWHWDCSRTIQPVLPKQRAASDLTSSERAASKLAASEAQIERLLY